MASRNYEIMNLPVPISKDCISHRQKILYRRGYIRGRLAVNRGDSITKESLVGLDSCFLRGLFDGYIAELDYELEQKIAKKD